MRTLFILVLLVCVVVSCPVRAQEMKYVSSNITMHGIRDVAKGPQEGIYRLAIVTAGTSNPLSVTKLVMNVARVSKQARTSIKIYYSGTINSFHASRLLRTDTITGPQGYIHLEQTLAAGVNYFWIVCNAVSSLVSFDLGLQDYQQAWADEFNGNAIDTSNWKFEKGFVRNNELQWYQESNAYCSNGMLVIEARREKTPNPMYEPGSTDWRKNREFIEYTSSSLQTAGKQSWLYGRFEMRARIDTVPGYWPAWWTLGTSKRWPANGEIDIMEYYRGDILANYAVLGQTRNAYWFTKTKSVRSFRDPNWKNNFHVWRMDWDEQGISIYVDDVLLNYQPQDSLYNRDGSGFFPFQQKHYMLLNLAIGGMNGGDPSQTAFPCKYEVDYVRVAQKVKGRFTHAGTYKPLLLTGTAGDTWVIPVDTAWAANSVNAAVFRKNSLVSIGDTQYIAYYNQQGTVVLGKRVMGGIDGHTWKLQQTPYKGNVNDAHNVISIMADGDGYLHMAWDHHNNKLHYARSMRPGSLDMGPEIAMTGKQENRVTYPEFYRLRDGNLLFLYRDGGSGNGNLVINRYDLSTQQWTSLQTNLIDGEGQRNAYWQACMDNKGTLHLSWVWRETPDVASNHDICYARSLDGGKTWEKSTGQKYQLPITAATAEMACPVPQRSELINQTSMFADDNGNPYIATYWRPAGSSVPQYHVVFKKDGRWQVQNLGFRATPFTLSGVGTRRIPISRPQIIAWSYGRTLSAALIFRDAERNSNVSVALAGDINQNKWVVHDIYDRSVGSWEPTYDTELWKKNTKLHLFVQNVEQADAEGKSSLPPQMVEVLEWDPQMSDRPSIPSVMKASVLEAMQRANNYWQANNRPQERAFWDVAAYHTGNMEAYFITRNDTYRKYSEAWAEHNQWKGAKSDNRAEWKYSYGEKDDYVLFGDWQICFQTYIDLYSLQKDPKKIARAMEVMEYQMSTPKNDYWWWADGLYMVMPVMTKLYKVTGNKQYLNKLHEYFSYANSIMYDSTEKLYYRDAKYVYPKHTSVNGKKDFWARGDGWVFAGLAKVLKDFPKDHPQRKLYLEKYRGMAAAIKKCQQPGGYWTRSMLDPEHAPGYETSGTAFFTYGLLWGINNGILDKKEYLPVAMKAWEYLSQVALQADGKLGYVQPIGERAIPGQVVDRNSTSNFGVGAFLLAACEMYRHLDSK